VVNISIEGNTAIFEVQGWDKLWAFRSRLEIPVEHLVTAYSDPECTIGWLDGIRLLGTSIPSVFRAGTFYQKGDIVFWDVHNVEHAIIIELEHEHFSKLVLEVEQPTEAIGLLNFAINHRQA
jgi:hypothetical protein